MTWLACQKVCASVSGVQGISKPLESMEAQTMDALRVKTDATSRVRPPIYNMHHMWPGSAVFADLLTFP